MSGSSQFVKQQHKNYTTNEIQCSLVVITVSTQSIYSSLTKITSKIGFYGSNYFNTV